MLHEYHVSITEMKWNSEHMAWEITIHTFIEDLEYAISKKRNETYVFKEENKQVIEAYIRDHFTLDNLSADNYTIIGLENDGHDLFVHIEYKREKIPTELIIHNTILTRYFSDQQNMHHISMLEKKYSAYLNADKLETKIKFNE